jgi:pullulanase
MYDRRFQFLIISVLMFALSSCKRAPAPRDTLPAPQATGVAVATVEIAPPAGNANRKIYAALVREGRIVGRGETTIPASGNVQVLINALDAATMVPDGQYDLWLVLDRDNLHSCYPSFGDLYVQEKWPLGKGARVKTLTDPSVWKEKRLSKSENLITIHYRRYDEDYSDVGIWTWDGHYKRTPEQNEIHEVGRDEYGLLYQMDRGEYGEKGDSDKIGLLPRLHASWDFRDSDDRFWRAGLGNEIYLIGTKNTIWTTAPDINPQVATVFIDAPNRLVVQLTRLVDPEEIGANKIGIVDDKGNRQSPALARVQTAPGKPKSTYIELATAEPLDLVHRSYKVSVAGFAGSATAVPRGVLDDPELFYDANAVLGATYSPTATSFRLFAPTARAVNVILYDEATGDKGRTTRPLRPAAKGIWEGAVSGDLKGKFYMYSLDGENPSPDREALDISCINSVNSGARARITDLAGTNPPGWDVAKVGPAVESPVDMVIYEMHVRDFTIAPNSPASSEHRGKYLGFIEAADHLKELGVTHVQLMPIQDFENDETSTNYNWGYVTTVYDSPEGWFAADINNDVRIREFKQLVAALHQRGIGVIMDVVYNHTASGAPFNFFVPRYYYRYLPDGSQSNGSGCGNDFRSEAPMARKYIIDSLKYWVREYGVDGFRFDLMALIDLDTMKQAEAELRAINPSIVLYGEPWGGGGKSAKVTPTNKQTIRGTGIGAFNDNIRNALVGSPFDKARGGFIQDGSSKEDVQRGIEGAWRVWAGTPAQAINYMSCHDNYTVWDKLKLSKPGATEQELKEMMKLGYLLLFTAQGVPFIHGGEEFGRSKRGHENSYNAPDSINQVDWSLKQKNADLYNYTRDIIALRKAHPVFRIRSKEQIAAWLKFPDTGNPDTLMYTLDGSALDGESWKQVCVLVNAADSISTDVKLPPGQWHVAFDQSGAVQQDRTVEGTARVRYKSGMILYQQ